MRRKRLWIGSTVLAAAVVVGGGALTLGSGGSSLVSTSVPTSKLAATLTTPGHPTRPNGMHRGFMMGLRPGSVYSESVLAVKGGGYKTVIGVRGVLTAISSTSVSVKRPDTGATVSASISSTTKFGRTKEATLASDLSSGKSVRVMLVETGGVAKLIAAMPAPGAHPLLHGLPAPKSNVSPSSSSSSATA